jgi:hypothetical protein
MSYPPHFTPAEALTPESMSPSVEPPLQAVAREGGEDEVPEIKPFTGLASCQVHNIVLHDDGIVIVRGHIGWDHDINVRLSIFVS